MNDDYENIDWNVHAGFDAYTPQTESDDPLSSFSHSLYGQESFASVQANIYPQAPSIAASIIPNSVSTESLASPQDNKPMSSLHTTVNANGSPAAKQSTNGHASPKHPSMKTIHVQVSDPQKHTDAQGTYINYLITTKTTLETFSSANPRPVRRRFQDFAWLHNTLTLQYPACIVPPLPEKHRLEYIKGDRFSTEFVERRRISLQWFLDRITSHPELQQSPCVRVFLESTNFKNDKTMQVKYVPPPASVLESLSDTLLNAFSRVKKPDERFVNMKESTDKFEDNLNTVERLYSRISKRQHDLEQDYSSFASSIQGLSGMETNMTRPLHEFAQTTFAYVDAMKDRSHNEDLQFLNKVHELLAYCHSVKMILRARDQKQVDFEELSAMLHRTTQERERMRHPGRNFDGGLNITEFVADKINEVRGVDLEYARREKLGRLERKIKELEPEVARAHDVSDAFSDQVVQEFEVFKRAKEQELKQGLVAYADSHIEFYQKAATLWEKILPELESIQTDHNTD